MTSAPTPDDLRNSIKAIELYVPPTIATFPKPLTLGEFLDERDLKKLMQLIDTYTERKCLEARIAELTRYDDSVTEITPDNFHDYYMARVVELFQPTKGDNHA